VHEPRAFSQQDLEKVNQAILDNSPDLNGVSVAELKVTGKSKFVSTGEIIQPANQFNPDWGGEVFANCLTHSCLALPCSSTF
jgi:hypothetical protein